MNTGPGRRARRGALLCALVALLAQAGCGLLGGPSLSNLEGRMLSTAEPPGVRALERLEALEPIAGWISREGQPDYLLVDSRRVVLLFYVERDQVVRFERPPLGGAFEPVPSRPIRSDHHMQFSNADRERLARLRGGLPQTPARPATGEGVRRRRVGGDEDSQRPPGEGGQP